MEFITVTNPLAQIFRYNKSKKKTLRFSEPVDARHPARDRPTNTYHTIKSLEECLETNPKALQEYAAKKDFSIENINFLIKVPKFRQEWELTFNSRNTTPERSRRRMFQEAVEIYTTFVNPETAKLQINISGSIHAQLKKLFGEATKAIAVRRPNTHHQPTSEVTPWETAPDTQPKAASQFKGLFDKAMKKVFDGPNTWFRRNSEHIRLIERLHNNPLANIHIPVEFDKHCFDAAESSIKGLVYTSTWQEFNKRNSNPAV